jgi:indole-3-glycerol phosphate synthase
MTTFVDFLSGMAGASRARARALDVRELERALRDLPPPRPLVLRRSFELIAEIKRSSPANGVLTREDDAALVRRARAYEAGGACALSILTEPTRFDGTLAHLALARGACELPVMRKDFLVAPAQLLEARAAGADGVLLIARLLTDAELTEMLAAARALGLFVLLEAFDEHDLERAALHVPSPGGPAFLLGVNARDLATLDVDRSRFSELARRLPRGVPAVAESGIESVDDARSAARAGYRALLVGTTLMRTADPRTCVAELLTAGREVHA